ncbi:MAG: HEPN domain-containing protein [Paludibacter sp.]
MKQVLDDESLHALVTYRVQRSKETLREAELMLHEGFINGALNRMYYSAYYIVIALLIQNGISTQTHAGAKQMLGLHFVLTEKLSIKISNMYSTLFEKRHSSDYDDFVLYDKEMVESLYPQVVEFINVIETLINKN